MTSCAIVLAVATTHFTHGFSFSRPEATRSQPYWVSPTSRLHESDSLRMVLYMVDPENKDETAESDESPLPTPQPPQDTPQLALLAQEYENLKTQKDQTAFIIEDLAKRASGLQQQLQEKQKELDQSRKEWTFEKTSFLQKIAELTGIVEQNEDVNEEERYRQEKLESEVVLLQGQIT